MHECIKINNIIHKCVKKNKKILKAYLKLYIICCFIENIVIKLTNQKDMEDIIC